MLEVAGAQCGRPAFEINIHYDVDIMKRTQITLDEEQHRRARRRAAELGLSLAGYIRCLVDADLAGPTPAAEPGAVFDLGDSGGSDVARGKDRMVGEALARSGESPDAPGGPEVDAESGAGFGNGRAGEPER